jgi:hypothetical protein
MSPRNMRLVDILVDTHNNGLRNHILEVMVVFLHCDPLISVDINLAN